MLIVLFIILILVAIYTLYELGWELFPLFCAICAGIVAFIMLVIGCGLATSSIIDQKIALYEERNQAIEERIDSTVKSYMEYENTTYTSFKSGDGMVKIYNYPELKADALVAAQIETYISNKEQIVKLKQEKIELGASRWWLYFGH